LGRDREAGGYSLRAEYAGHLGDVGALAAEQLAHVAGPLGELVDPFQDAGNATRSRVWPWCSAISAIARSTWRRARSSPEGASASGRPSASAMKAWASTASGNEPASHALHTTPPAAPLKPVRCSRSPQAAQAASWGENPAASSSFSRKASWLARVACAAGSPSSRASSLHSRW